MNMTVIIIIIDVVIVRLAVIIAIVLLLTVFFSSRGLIARRAFRLSRIQNLTGGTADQLIHSPARLRALD